MSPSMTPAALPPELDGPAVWLGPAMAARSDWIEPLSAADRAEIDVAMRPLVLARTDIARLTQADFALPTLGPRLARIRAEVLRGRGFALLRGLPVDRWSPRESATAFFGIGTHLGHAVSQNGRGHVLGHVKDLGLRSDDPAVRIYHTDSCDIVGLLCLQTAREGGQSALVSSSTIWNEMRRRRPDLAALLLQPIATDRRGEVPAGDKPYFTIPVFNWHAGEMSAIYQRQYIDSAQRFADAPRLAATDVEALDLFDELANDPSLNFLTTLQRGDIQLVHNHTLLHDRTAFTDGPEPARRRHLLRLWLAPDDARALPPVFVQRYGSVMPGRRGGVPARARCAPLAAG
jgi:hypothetical protein